MDFDLSKENIQPLRGGRNVSQLGLALQAQSNPDFQRELQQQREEFETAIRNYSGDDPLDNWYHYISWIEQSYPKHGHEGNFVALLQHCLGKFESDKRYTNDRRFCKLWIKYIDLIQNPLELYQMMYARELCRGCADLYKAWAYYHEAAGDFQNANLVFEYGKRELAQPYDELLNSQENLVRAAGLHMIHGSDEHLLQEKRQALTSLLTYKPGRVGSVRQPISGGPGAFPISSSSFITTTNTSKTNIGIPIYDDRNNDGVAGAAAAIGPISILTAAKRHETPKENTLKPGPWNTAVPVKKRLAGQSSTPAFTVHEDDADNSENEMNGLKLPPNFATCTSETYDDWIVSIKYLEPKDDRLIPMYPKNLVYSQPNTEFSLEELKAINYYTKKNSIQQIEMNEAVESILPTSMMEQTNIESEKNEFISHQSYKEQKPDFSPVMFTNEEILRQSPLLQPVSLQPPLQLFEGPIAPQPSFNIWDSPSEPEMLAPKMGAFKKISIYEESNLDLVDAPKVSAMKTPLKDLNVDEFVETGSRGGMDYAAAVAPIDSAKRLSIFEDDNSSSSSSFYENNSKIMKNDDVFVNDLSCNTQMFNFNLNAMQVSTPQNKLVNNNNIDSPIKLCNSKKQLFTEYNNQQQRKESEKILSTILEETKSYGSMSSSSGATTKSRLSTNNYTKQQNMATISEEHNSYLAQNMMANADLRRSLLGDLMDFDNQQLPVAEDSSRIEQLKGTNYLTNEIKPLNTIPSDPFATSLINKLLKHVQFPGKHTKHYYLLHNIPRMIVRKETITIGHDKYVLEKQLGKGTFGVVFRGTDVKNGRTVALKYQKDGGNKWEFYICRELQVRLADHPLKDRFMDIKIGYFSDQASIFISEFMPCGSLLDVTNAMKQKSGRPMKESLCIYFCLDMLRVMKAMHDVKIIHADIKPDNFLVKLSMDSTVSLQLIDFGRSIDMTLFPNDAHFTRIINTEDFICCEMKDGRPWNYHTDLFCVAATAHVLLFDKYIQLQNKEGHWSISHRMPRYLRLDLWNMFFSTLLNQQSGPADTTVLQNILDESLKIKADDFYNDMRYLLNILRNR